MNVPPTYGRPTVASPFGEQHEQRHAHRKNAAHAFRIPPSLCPSVPHSLGPFLRLFAVLAFLNFGVSLAYALPPDTAEARKLLEKLGTRFSAEYAPHFTIISDAEAPRVAELRDLAESTFEAVEAFARHFRLPARRPENKMTVVYFNTWEDYERYADRTGFPASQWVPGFFDHHTARCIMFNYADSVLIREKREEIERARRELQPSAHDELEPVQPPKDAAARASAIDEMSQRLDNLERQINTTVFRHELAHQVLHHMHLQPPHLSRCWWLVEGLAMQFEPESGINPHRLADFLAIEWSDSELSFRTIITEPRVIGAGSEQAPAAYAAAWALVYYLATAHPEDFARYLVEVIRADPPDGPTSETELKRFEKYFGPLDDAFEKKARAHVAARRKNSPHRPPTHNPPE